MQPARIRYQDWWRFFAGVGLWLAVVEALVYGIWNTSRADDSAWDLSAGVGLLAVSLFVGAFAGLPVVAAIPLGILLAAPAGYNLQFDEDLPIAAILLLQTVFFFGPAMLVGGLARVFWRRFRWSRAIRGSRSAPGSGPPAVSRR